MNGKHVVKFGKGYLSRIREEATQAAIYVVIEINKAKFMELDQALKIKESHGGKVLKINLDLEEV